MIFALRSQRRSLFSAEFPSVLPTNGRRGEREKASRPRRLLSAAQLRSGAGRRGSERELGGSCWGLRGTNSLEVSELRLSRAFQERTSKPPSAECTQRRREDAVAARAVRPPLDCNPSASLRVRLSKFGNGGLWGLVSSSSVRLLTQNSPASRRPALVAWEVARSGASWVYGHRSEGLLQTERFFVREGGGDASRPWLPPAARADKVHASILRTCLLHAACIVLFGSHWN